MCIAQGALFYYFIYFVSLENPIFCIVDKAHPKALIGTSLFVPSQSWMPFCLPPPCSWVAGTWETWPPGSRLLSCSTSGLYIRPLINPQWKPQDDILTGQAPALDRSWFITTESQPTLIYFCFGEEGRLRTEKRCWLLSTWCQDKTSRLPKAIGH